MPGNRGGRGQGQSRAQSFNQEDPSQRGQRNDQQQTIADRQVSAQTQRSTISNGASASNRGGGRSTGFGGGRNASSRTNPSGRVISPRTGKEFGKQQSGIAKTVGATMKSQAGQKGPRKPATAANAAVNNPRARLPNLDDIQDEMDQAEENARDGRRYVDYDVYYATSGAKQNRLKDKYKREKLRSKRKGTGLLGNVQVSSGESILDVYKDLGKSFRR